MLKSGTKSILKILRWQKKIGIVGAIRLKFIENSKKRERKKIHFNLFGNRVELFLRSSTTDISVFNQMFICRDYDINIPFAPKNILDAGANIGLSSLFFSRKFPLSKIVSVEPDRDNFELLVINTKKEGNIISLNNALWNEKCFLKITDDNYNKDAITVSKSNNENHFGICAYSVEDILEINGISEFDIVKMDIEGSEATVFSSNTSWLKNVRVLIIELHDWIDRDCSKNVFKALLDWGFYMLIRAENLICYRDYNDYLESLNKKNYDKKN